MKLIGALEIICDQCGAQPGDKCTFMYGTGSRRKKEFRFGCHTKRVRDAEAATQAVNVLLDS